MARTLKRKLSRIVNLSRGYDVVEGFNARMRPRATIEYGGEDSSLPFWNRLNMIALARQGARNGDTLRALMQQMRNNVIGTVAGKATFNFADADLRKQVTREFAKWARTAEFSDDLSLAMVLELIVDTKMLGGDLVLVFDDGLVEDSGRILAFEPDEIANVVKDWFAEKFPAGWTQRQGRIYNHNGRFMGVIVSHKYRGRGEFPRDENGVWFLTVDRNAAVQDWIMLREVWRFNQGRGVPPVAAPLDTLLDLESVTKYEVQAALKNSQTLGQIVNTSPTGGDANGDEVPEEIDEETARAAGLDVSELQNGGAGGAECEELELENLPDHGVVFDLMPDNVKMELLDTKHPNANMEAFIKWLGGRAGAALGLGKCYSTMEASTSYTAFRGEQVMTWPTFAKAQKRLEREVLDWVVAKAVPWLARHGRFDLARLPEDWAEGVRWAWPLMPEVDSKATFEANKIALESGQKTLADFCDDGDPEGFYDRLAKERDALHARGLLSPLEKSVNGTVFDLKGNEKQ